MPHPGCFGDIGIYLEKDECEECPAMNACNDEVFRRNDLATLRHNFGEDDEIDRVKEQITAEDARRDASSGGDSESETPSSRQETSSPSSFGKLIAERRHKDMLDKRRAEMTEDEKAETSSMTPEQYERWLNARRGRRSRTKDRKERRKLARPAIGRDAIKAERDRRRSSLAVWVDANRGQDRFARSLVDPLDQKQLITAWLVRELLRSKLGIEPTLRAIAERLGEITTQSTSWQSVDRLINKIDKLEAEGRPWCPPHSCA